ncbi:hypothetical protein BDB00DRAFT_877636 [Zychaea mexicana]|uniref:uncharacterized protein n=1 Tax=Zychaea mexicana TaxID=64656 RepID=UPI0022FDD3BE|nr:uncharacterized protein BDB00DRAFT_877636 [Zychaea mexicana]KAI9488251.1 hypothetical protein BDB00DRAFT_877636 [Zychaea mexicana]
MSFVQTQSPSQCHFERMVLTIPPLVRHRRQLGRSFGKTSLRAKCIVQIDYPHYHHPNDYFSLENLDKILDQGVLTIQISFYFSWMNGLACVEPMIWIEEPLQLILRHCGLQSERLDTTTQTQHSHKPDYRFRLLRSTSSSINSPLSTMLQRPAPQANLIKIYLLMDWETEEPDSLTDALQEPTEMINEYLFNAMFHVFCENIGPMYPLVFSPVYAQKMVEITHLIPVIAQSVYKIVSAQQLVAVDHDRQSQPSATNQGSMAIIQRCLRDASILRRVSVNSLEKNNDEGATITWTDLVVLHYYKLKCSTPVPKFTKITYRASKHAQQKQQESSSTVLSSSSLPTVSPLSSLSTAPSSLSL